MNPFGHPWPQKTGTQRIPVRLAWLVILLFIGGNNSSLHAHEAPSTTFLHQLHTRQLYRLAEIDARRRLTATDLADHERAKLAGLLLKSIAHQAMESPNTTTELWNSATATYEQVRAAIEDPLSQAEVDLQFQLVQLWRTTAIFPAGAYSEDLSEVFAAASDSLRTIETSIEKIRQRVDVISRTNNSGKVSDTFDARQLGYRIQFKLAEVYQHHASCYDRGTSDQVYLLTQALDHYAAVSRVIPNSELTLISRLQEIACHRQLRNFSLARQQLDQFPVKVATPPVRRQQVIQEAELRIAQGEPTSAANLLKGELNRPVSQESWDIRGAVQVSLVHAYAAASRKTNNAVEQKRWQTLALELLNEVEETQSSDWVRQAESWITTRSHYEAHVSDVDLLARTAANLFRYQKIDEAHETFLRASEQAADLGLNERAFELAFQAAAIRHQSGQLEQAATEFIDIAARFPELSRAREAHWLVVILTAGRVREHQDLLENYTNLLSKHAQRWPMSQTGKTALLWHGRLLIQRRLYEDALEKLERITPPFNQSKETFLEIQLAFEQWLQTLPESQQNDIALRAVEYFASQSQETNFGRQKSPQSDPVAEAKLAAFWFALIYRTPTAHQLKEITNPEMQARCESSSPHMTHALLGLAAALDTQIDTASQHWARVNWREVASRISLLRRLDQESHELRNSENDARNRALTSIQLDLTNQIESDSNFQSNAQFGQLKAAALTRLGRRDEAIALYAQLVASSPKNVSLQATLAQLWTSGKRIEDAKQGLAHWRRAARLSQDGSDVWFQAKLGIAKTLIRLGEKQRAADSIRIMQALHPSLGGKYKPSFLDLLEQTDAEIGSQ